MGLVIYKDSVYVSKNENYSFATLKNLKAIEKLFRLKKITVYEPSNIDDAIKICQKTHSPLFLSTLGGIDRSEFISRCSALGIITIIQEHVPDKPNCYSIRGDIKDSFTEILNLYKIQNKTRTAVYSVNSMAFNDLKIAETFKKFTGLGDNNIFYKNSVEGCYKQFFERRYEFDSIICINDIIAFDFIVRMINDDPRYFHSIYIVSCLDTILSSIFKISLSTMSYSSEAFAVAVYDSYKIAVSKRPYKMLTIDILDEWFPRQTTGHFMQDLNNIDELTKAKDCLNIRKKFCDSSFEENQNFFSVFESMLLDFDILDFNILRLLMKHNTFVEMGEKLFISSRTIQNRVSKMLSALKVKSKKELEEILNYIINLENLELYIAKLNKK